MYTRTTSKREVKMIDKDNERNTLTLRTFMKKLSVQSVKRMTLF